MAHDLRGSEKGLFVGHPISAAEKPHAFLGERVTQAVAAGVILVSIHGGCFEVSAVPIFVVDFE